MEKLIVIENGEKYFFNDLKEVVKTFLCDNYYELSSNDQTLTLEKKSYANALFKNVPIIDIRHTYYQIDTLLENPTFLLYDEIIYILSLIKNNNIILLERIDANILPIEIDKTLIKDNYLVVNKFVDQVIQNYLKAQGRHE